MTTRVESDVSVQRFRFLGDAQGRRLQFPRAEAHDLEGRSGAAAYGARDASCDALEGRLDTLRWTAEAASLGHAWLKDDSGRYDIAVDRIELPRGALLTRADRGVEIVAPYVSFSETKLTVTGPFGLEVPTPAPRDPGELRQDKLRFLDSLTGRIYLTVKVVLDLPVIGKRTLDQELRVPIQEGSLDFRALDDSLDWLEGAVVDIRHDEPDKLAVSWKVPIFGRDRDLVAWKLDRDASTLASFGRIPVRSLADFVLPGRGNQERRTGVFRQLSLDAIDIAFNLVAPRSFEVGGGVVMFGGDGEPGMVDFKVTGGIHDSRPGRLDGAIGSIDTTIKDIKVGPAVFSADRLHFDGLDNLVVTFDNFRPQSAAMVIHRVTATNLMLTLATGPGGP